MIRFIQGDCRGVLATLPAESVHCCITSPPYWGLRDYGVSGQIGLEATFTDFVAEMVGVFREVRRVLRPDGTLWLNLGDSYAGYWGEKYAHKPFGEDRTPDASTPPHKATPPWKSMGVKPKDLVGIPWRVAFALQADGWWLRQDIIWHKPNPMPESATDRCTKAHEYMFLLTKSARYFFDAESIKEDSITGDPRRPYGSPGANALDPRGRQGNGAVRDNPSGRNKRSVWTVATAPFSGAHFAAFPPELIKPCIKAGTSEKGCCSKCGMPWERITKSTFIKQQDVNSVDGIRGVGKQKPMDDSNGWQGFPRGTTSRETLGWQPSCQCNAPISPCTILDPFGGAGTTALVANDLRRDVISIELNPDFIKMGRKRLPRLFAEVIVE
jgi:DNA modification methylase